MSSNKSEAKNGGPKAAPGFVTKTRVVASAAVMGVGAVSIAAAMVMVPAMGNAVLALGGFAVHNPVLFGVVGLFMVGQAGVLRPKSSKSGKSAAWVACGKCNRVFRDQAEVERHSAGYHV
jgi:hypothetical protein